MTTTEAEKRVGLVIGTVHVRVELHDPETGEPDVNFREREFQELLDIFPEVNEVCDNHVAWFELEYDHVPTAEEFAPKIQEIEEYLNRKLVRTLVLDGVGPGYEERDTVAENATLMRADMFAVLGDNVDGCRLKYTPEYEVAMYVNAEAKLRGLPVNEQATTLCLAFLHGTPKKSLCGPAVLVAHCGSRIMDIPEDFVNEVDRILFEVDHG